MDSSPRHHESGSPLPPYRPRRSRVLPPFNLQAWLRFQEVTDQAGWQGTDHDGDARPSPSRHAFGASTPHRTSHSTHGRQVAQVAPQGRPARAKVAGKRSADSAVRPSQPIERLARPAAYLMKIPPAVAGQRGHDRTFHAACILIQGFDLTIDEARPLLHQWNLGCTPPWSTAELEHKLVDALKAGDSRPRGYLWDHGFQSSGKNLRRDSRHESNGPGSGPRPSRLGNDFPPTPPLPLDTCPDGHEANPHRLAQQFLMSTFAFAGGIGLRYWRDEFHSWDGTAYNAVPAGEMRAQVDAIWSPTSSTVYTGYRFWRRT